MEVSSPRPTHATVDRTASINPPLLLPPFLSRPESPQFLFSPDVLCPDLKILLPFLPFSPFSPPSFLPKIGSDPLDGSPFSSWLSDILPLHRRFGNYLTFSPRRHSGARYGSLLNPPQLVISPRPARYGSPFSLLSAKIRHLIRSVCPRGDPTSGRYRPSLLKISPSLPPAQRIGAMFLCLELNSLLLNSPPLRQPFRPITFATKTFFFWYSDLPQIVPLLP